MRACSRLATPRGARAAVRGRSGGRARARSRLRRARRLVGGAARACGASAPLQFQRLQPLARADSSARPLTLKRAVRHSATDDKS
ncbi:MAG TPA: hypothetical protein DC063_14095 [Arenimonas sp.]|nr:hypothetical protein [Arenimonas sp.]